VLKEIQVQVLGFRGSAVGFVNTTLLGGVPQTQTLR
jgi:hypothetical protein